jgi:integrase
MAVYRRGKKWWYSFEFEGRRIQESAGLTNRTAALRAEAKRKADLLDRRAGFTRRKLPPKFEEFVSVFLAWSKQQHRPKTYELHDNNCKSLKRYFEGKWLDEVTPGMVEGFKLARVQEKRWGEEKERAVSGVTVNRALASLRLMFNYAERCGYQVPNPVKGVEFYKEPRHIRTISLEEEIAYFAAASQPLKDIARIILDTGMRPDEVFRIEFANVDFSQRSIFNTFGKTPAARRKLTMTDEVYSILKRRAICAKSRYAFPSPANPDRPIGRVHKAHYGAVDRAAIKPRFILYDFRHTYASRAVMAGVDLPTLAALLGHTNIQMSMRYVHPAEEHKREAVNKIENFKIAEALKLAEKSQRVSTISTTMQSVN